MLKITITGDRAEGKTTLAGMFEKALRLYKITFEKEYGKEDIICITNSEQIRKRNSNR